MVEWIREATNSTDERGPRLLEFYADGISTEIWPCSAVVSLLVEWSLFIVRDARCIADVPRSVLAPPSWLAIRQFFARMVFSGRRLGLSEPSSSVDQKTRFFWVCKSIPDFVRYAQRLNRLLGTGPTTRKSFLPPVTSTPPPPELLLSLVCWEMISVEALCFRANPASPRTNFARLPTLSAYPGMCVRVIAVRSAVPR